MKCKKKKLMPLFLIALCAALMTACSGGGSDADKAYAAWVEDTAPVLEQATVQMNEAINTATDNQEKLRVIEEYLSVLKPATDELVSIDSSKFTQKNKDAVSAQISSLQKTLSQCEYLRGRLSE